MKLVIGNKNYSSWSLRPWLFMAYHQLDFEEIRLAMFEPAWEEQIQQYSPSGFVPVLDDQGLIIWDSIAICEYLSEQYLQDSGIDWTIVRPNFFMQNLLNTAGPVKGQGKMMMPFDPEVPIGMIDARDSAAVCAIALTEDGYAEKLLEVTGALVTLNDCASALSDVLGTEVPFVRAPLEMAQKMAMDNGAPDWATEHIGNIVRDIEAGTMSRDTGTVAEILGRPARTIGAFFADHAALFRT